MITPPDPVRGARLMFSLDPAVSHLNHGSFGAVPLTVQRAQQRLRDEVAANPHRFYSRGLGDRLAHVRGFLADAVGADRDGCALVANATAGVGIALRSVAPGSGTEVVTTDHGYGAVDLAVNRICRDGGATHRKLAVPLYASDDEIVELFAGAVESGRTGMVIIDQISSPTARLFPVTRIIEAVRARAPRAAILVDGAHAPGMMPLTVRDLGADFWVGNLHKWSFAPPGTALLAVSPPWRSRIVPPVVSWELDAGFPTSVEYQGTIDYTAWLAAPSGVFMLRTLGAEAVRGHNAALAAWGQSVIAEALGVAPAELPYPDSPVSMRVIPLPAGVAATVADAFELRDRIGDSLATDVAVSPWQGRGLLRVSGQVYNQPHEYEQLAAGLPALLNGLRRRT